MITVSTREQLEAVLFGAGLTPTPLPQGHLVEIGELVIERAVLERTFECGHDVSTDRFVGESDYCAVCEQMCKIVE